MVDEPETVNDGAHAPPESGSGSVVVASFKSRRLAESMVASLGHSFRHRALKGSASAWVVTRGSDGSFRLVQSRIVTATGIVANVSKFVAIVMAGLIGIGPAIKGVKAAGHRAHQRQSGVGQDADRLAQVFDQLGPHGACVLLYCTDERGDHSSHYARTEFLALLARLGTAYDWIRPAVAEPAPRGRKKRRSGGTMRHSG